MASKFVVKKSKIVNKDLDYSTTSYYAYKEKMIQLIGELNPKWSDRSDTDIGMTILNAVNAIRDLLQYKMDKEVTEAYFSEVQEYNNAISHCKLFPYRPNLQTSAELGIQMIYKDSSASVFIPAMTNFLASNKNASLNFFNPQDIILNRIEAGEISNIDLKADLSEKNLIVIDNNVYRCVSLYLVQGDIKTINLNYDLLKSSYGYQLPSQKIDLKRMKISIWDTSGNYIADLSQVDNIYLAENLYSYSLNYDRDQLFYLKVHPYVLLKFNNHKLILTYIDTLGAEGNMTIEEITMNSTEKDSNNRSIQYYLEIRADSESIGGKASDTIDQIKRDMPLSISTMDYLVTLEDYESYLRSLPTIHNVKSFDWHGDNKISKGFILKHVIVPTGYNQIVPQALDTALVEYLQDMFNQKKKFGGLIHIFQESDYYDIELQVNLYTTKGRDKNLLNNFISDLKTNIRLAYYSEDLTYGSYIAESDLYAIVENLDKDGIIERFTLDIYHEGILIENDAYVFTDTEFLRLKNVLINTNYIKY